MERDLPWRVLEVPETAEVTPSADAGPAASVPRDPRRSLAIAVLVICATLAAAIAVLLIANGPRPGTLVLDADAAGPRGSGALVGSFAPNAGLVAGPGRVNSGLQ